MKTDWDNFIDNIRDIASGNTRGFDTTKNPGTAAEGGNNSRDGRNDNNFDSPNNSSNSSSSGGSYFNSVTSKMSTLASNLNAAINSPAMLACAKLTAMGLASSVLGLTFEAFAIAATAPTFGASLPLGTSIAGLLIATGTTATIAGVACIASTLTRGDGSGAAPENLSPKGAGRTGAFKQAKRDAGIPASSQPDKTVKVADTTNPGKTVKEHIWGETKIDPKTNKVTGVNGKSQTIQDHSHGHNFGTNNPQNRGPHFNGPANNSHYDY